MIELPDEMVVEFLDTLNCTPASPRKARALFVGGLLVRAAFDDEYTLDMDMRTKRYAGKRWCVDHRFAKSLRVCDLADFGLALLVADEVSRFSPGDLEHVRSPGEMRDAVGNELGNWIQYVSNVDGAIARGHELPPTDPPHPWHFRAWCAFGEPFGTQPPVARACAAGEIFEARHG